MASSLRSLVSLVAIVGLPQTAAFVAAPSRSRVAPRRAALRMEAAREVTAGGGPASWWSPPEGLSTAAAASLAAGVVLAANPSGMANMAGGVAWADDDDTPAAVLEAPAPAPRAPVFVASPDDAEEAIQKGLDELARATTKPAVLSSMEKIAEATGVLDEDFTSLSGDITPIFKRQTAVKLSELRAKGGAAWRDDDGSSSLTAAYGTLKRLFDPLHVVELAPYLSVLPFIGGAVYLVLLGAQRFVPDLFQYAYVVGAVLTFAPLVFTYFSAA